MIDYPLKTLSSSFSSSRQAICLLLIRGARHGNVREQVCGGQGQNSHFVALLGVLQRAHVAPLHSLAEDHNRQARFPLHRC
jgi:hypothetical protein